MRIKHLFNCGIAVLGLTASLTLSPNSAQATLLAYEGFDYTDADGTVVSSLATPGGIGWTGNWGEANNDTITTASITSPGLNYPGFYLTPGSKAIAVPPGGRYYRPFGSGTYASPEKPLDGTYWYSALSYPSNTIRGGTLCVFGKPADPQNGFGVRVDRPADDAGGWGAYPTNVLAYQAWGDNGGSGNGSAIKITNGFDKVYFILGKIVMNTNGTSSNTIWVYEDPAALPTVEPVSGGLTLNATTAAANFFKAVTGRTFSTGGRPPVVWDEVRVGTTFAEVLLPTGPTPTFALSPTTGIENQSLTFNWANIPVSATAIVLNPGAVDLIPSTTSGAGSTSFGAPAVSTQYVLTYTVAGVPTSLTNQYTAIAPFFTITPAVTNQNRNLTLAWRVPVGSNPVTIESEGNPPDDYTNLSPDGSGSTVLLAPGSSTNYILRYTYNAVTLSITQQFTLAPASFIVPNPAIENGAMPLSWSIPLGFSDVFIEYGPVGGPLTSLNVTAQTDAFFGTGTDNTLFATLVNTNFTLRYTNSGIGYAISTNIAVYPQIFTNLAAVNNTKPVVINAAPMQNDVAAYSDRTHVWAAVPSILQGAQFVKFGQDDKFTANLQVSFNAAKDATFFLLLDNRVGDNVGGNTPLLGTDSPPLLPNPSNSMAWVLSSGFVDTGVDIGLDENFVAGTNTIDQSYSVYFRQVSAGDSFTFFELNDLNTGGPGGRNMYGVAGVAPQVVPVAFIATDLELTNGQPTTLQWTVPAGSDVSINNGIGNVSNITDVVFGTGSTNIVPALGTNIYTLTYNPPGPSTPPVSLAPVTVIVYPPAIADYPTNISYSITGNTLSLTWPETHSGWYVSSNAVNVADTNFWFDVPNSETGTSLNVTIDTSKTNVFYRLRQP